MVRVSSFVSLLFIRRLWLGGRIVCQRLEDSQTLMALRATHRFFLEVGVLRDVVFGRSLTNTKNISQKRTGTNRPHTNLHFPFSFILFSRAPVGLGKHEREGKCQTSTNRRCASRKICARTSLRLVKTSGARVVGVPFVPHEKDRTKLWDEGTPITTRARPSQRVGGKLVMLM